MEKKFDFKPFDKVLVRIDNVWRGKHYDGELYMDGRHWYRVTESDDIFYEQCIPFKGNEHLHNTTDDYEEAYEPKKGDFVRVAKDNLVWWGIFNGEKGNCILLVGVFSSHSNEYRDEIHLPSNLQVTPATDEQKQLLLDKMHEAGKDWDAEKMEVVDYKWMPKKDEVYYAPVYGDMGFNPSKYHNYYEPNLKDVYAKGWVFKTEAECQALCDKLKEAIKNVK